VETARRLRFLALLATVAATILACSGGASAAGSGGRLVLSLGKQPGATYPVYYLWTLSANGGGLHRLNPFHRPGEYSPAWSPDGRTIAFSRSCSAVIINGEEIWTMHADGSDPVRLTGHCGGADSPAWSPDGSTIDYANIEIWRMNSDGSGSLELTHPPPHVFDKAPSFSPDGKTVLFIRYDERPKIPRSSLWRMNADGTSPALLLSPSRTVLWEARYSPDGKTIAVAANTLQLVAPDGSHRRDTKLRTTIAQFAWSPNSREIACTCRQNGVWIYNLGRRKAKRTFRFAPSVDGAMGIDWSR
jgi:Tol biopolymer transport system component